MKSWTVGEELLASDLNSNFSESLFNSLNGILAGENLTALDPAYISPNDGTIFKAHGFKAGTSAGALTAATTSYKTAKLSTGQFLYLTHSGSTLTVEVWNSATGAIVTSATVSTSFDTTSISTTMPGATVCRLSDTTFVVFYAKTSDSHLWFRTGSISGSTITMDTDTQFPGNPNYCFAFDSRPGASDGKIVLTYADSGNNPGNSTTVVSTLSYLTVTTNSVTVTYTTTYSTSSGSFWAEPRWTTAAYSNGIAYGLFSIADAGGMNVISYSFIDVDSGDVIGGNIVPNLESQTGSGTPASYAATLPYFVGHNGKAYFGYQTNNGGSAYVNTKTIIEVSTAGARQFYQHSTVKLAGDTTITALPMFGNEMGIIVTGFTDTSSGGSSGQGRNTLYIQRDKIYTFYDATALSIISNGPPKPFGWYSNQRDEIVFSQDGSTTKTWKLPTLFDGLVYATVTATNAAKLIFACLVTTSSLSATRKYFLKDTYSSAGEIATKGVIPIGKSITTTKLLVKNYEL